MAQETEMAGAAPPTVPVLPVRQATGLSPVASVVVAFLVLIAVGGVAIVVGSAIYVVLFIPLEGGSEAIGERLKGDPGIMFASMIPSQLAMLAVACLWRWRNAPPFRQRLGLVSPHLTGGQWAMVLASAGIPFAVSVLAAASMAKFSFSDPEALGDMWTSMTGALAVFWVAYIGIGPGIVEEMYFRGFMQRRLLSARSAFFSIGLTSLFFAIVHIDPPAFMLALVLGIWLGWLSWKTGSILPSIATHALINSGWNLAQVSLRKVEVPEWTIWTGCGALFVISLICFVGTIRMLRGRPPADPVVNPSGPAEELPAARSS
ncbi:MAG: CPBP family intramembrane metalloprotease [Phycisphaerales bacterium]|nr:CPBP family intramembrane metalloprotease [Phycisphaerales bacterium]